MASKGVNKVILVGRVGKDPEVRYTPSGSAVASFSVATSESWKDRNTGEKVERTEWHSCTAFSKLAEIIGKYLRKGSMVYLEGRIQTDKYQDKQTGQDKYSTKIIVNDMQMLGDKPQQDRQQQPRREPANSNVTFDEDMDDDIPF